MARVTIAAPVAPARTATDAAAEQLLRGVVAALVPHLHAQIGAIQNQTGDQAGTTWTTEGWLADGTWVWLAVPVGAGEVVLDLDTAPALKRPKPASTREKLALACATAVAALAGWRHFGTVAGLLGAALSGLAAATAVEIALKVRDDQQEAAARVLDEAAWRTRLREAAGSGPGVLDP